MLEFWKYHGTGNDFVLLDGIANSIQSNAALAIKICDRHFGIGSDGLIVIQKSSDADFEMVFYNPDGSQSFCGNGSRCAVKFAADRGYVKGEGLFIAIDGKHEFKVDSLGKISIHMKDTGYPTQIENDYELNTGSPHYIRFCENVGSANIIVEGRSVRYSERYHEKGINVNLVELVGQEVHMRTYERGVEDETLSCGTGVTAAALTSAHLNHLNSPVKVLTKGGELSVHFDKTPSSFVKVWLQGPAEFVFTGKWSI